MELLILTTTDGQGYSSSYQFSSEKFHDIKIEAAEWYLKNNYKLDTNEFAYLSRGSKTIISEGITENIVNSPRVINIDDHLEEYEEHLETMLKEKELELSHLKSKQNKK